MPKLDKYRAMRDEARTNEPFGSDVHEAHGPTRAGAFVIHQHGATRMHWDLRLEIGGVLASFAVPRGPSLNPDDKRLAVNTEDHPIEYLEFEAVIPEGQYGAGPMIVWDRGKVRYLEGTAEEGVARGKIDFELEGIKTKGRFGLAKIKSQTGKENEWLLLKKKDAYASKDKDLVKEYPRSVLSGLTIEELEEASKIADEIEREAAEMGAKERDFDGRGIAPMACALEGAPLAGKGWLYELKLDGVRAIASKRGANVVLTGRKQKETTATYPEVARAVRALPCERVVLDGEIVAFDERGRPSFQRLGARIHVKSERDVKKAMVDAPVMFLAFDLLAVGKYSLVDVPLEKRKKLLAKLVPGAGVLRSIDAVEGDGRALKKFCEDHDLEGVVAKRASSTYQIGRRSPDWVKIKCEHDDDFVVVGYCKGSGQRSRLGSLDIATYANGALVYRGRAGSGLDDKTIDKLMKLLPPLAVDHPTSNGVYAVEPNGRVHVKPELVVRVRYLEFSEDGQVRHPVFVGLRDDVDPEDCRAGPRGEEVLLEEPEIVATKEDVRDRTKVNITNRNKVLFPADGYTKQDLCDYYASIAPVMVPFLKDRPIMMVRYPDGIQGKNFYQWHVPPSVPSWMRTLRLSSDEEGVVDVFVVDSADALVFVANLAAIPIHVLASRAGRLDKADFFTIDFDVKALSLSAGITLAKTLRELLDAIGLAGFPKTSGQSGLHVFVPLGESASFDTARALADLLGRLLVARHPDIATMERKTSKRGPKVYVDTGQTGKTRTIVAPYAVRAQNGAPVSTPLTWDEVREGLDPRAFTIKTVPDRVKAIGDPMANLFSGSPDVARAVVALQKLL